MTEKNILAIDIDDVLAELRPTYFIDNQLKHCHAAAGAGIKTVLFGDYAWNKGADLERRGIVRCASWHDVGNYFVSEGVVREIT